MQKKCKNQSLNKWGTRRMSPGLPEIKKKKKKKKRNTQSNCGAQYRGS